jgi:aminopeptidase N
MVVLGAAAAVVAACGGDDDGGGGTPDAMVLEGAASFEVTHYDVDLDLATDKATVDVDLRTTSPGRCLTIGFVPDAADAVAIGGVAAAGVDISLSADTLTACDPASVGWPADTTLTLSVTATVPRAAAPQPSDPDLGLSTETDRGGGQFTYLVSWVGGCHRHGPCDARPDTFPTYRFTVHHDANTQVLCPGVLSASPVVTTCDFAYPGGPTYSTYGLAARSPAWSKSSLGTWGDGVAVSLYDVPGSQIAAEIDTPALSGFFAWMEQTFGDYPYGGELRLFVGDTYWAGFEHPGNIALSEYLATGGSSYFDGLTHTTMHEIAHQWAGDQATLADTYDFVWKEAMAEYLTFVYEDEHLPAGVAAKSANAWKSFAVGSAYHLVPDERPELFEYYGDVYGPGPMILFRQLEVMYGRDKVLAALDALIGTGAPRTLSVEDVRDALEAATGAELGAYFEAWVYGAGAPSWPSILVNVAPKAGGAPNEYEVAVSSSTADGVPRGAAFTVRITGANAGEVVDVAVSNGPSGGAYPVQTVVIPFTPVATEVDPFDEALVFPASMPKPAPRRLEPWRISR